VDANGTFNEPESSMTLVLRLVVQNRRRRKTMESAMLVAGIHSIHLFHKDKSADGNVDDHDDYGSLGANRRSAVALEHYTLLLKGASYFIDSDTRERVLQARRLGGDNVSFQPVIACPTCACPGTVTISPSDVLGFIAHDGEKSESLGANVVPLRIAG
jgi:hypothetical protein